MSWLIVIHGVDFQGGAISTGTGSPEFATKRYVKKRYDIVAFRPDHCYLKIMRVFLLAD